MLPRLWIDQMNVNARLSVVISKAVSEHNRTSSQPTTSLKETIQESKYFDDMGSHNKSSDAQLGCYTLYLSVIQQTKLDPGRDAFWSQSEAFRVLYSPSSGIVRCYVSS